MPASDDRVFNPNPDRHYRRRYARGEVFAGAAVLLGLVLITTWVVYKGQHPDPEILGQAPGLQRRDAIVQVDRSPLPNALAPTGWSEQSLSRFDAENVFIKINGREGFFKSFGFVELVFVSLQLDEDPSVAVDVEVYDLGKPENALGCFSAEAPEGAEFGSQDGGLRRHDRNARYLTRGKLYIRAVGSEESPRISAVLEHVERALTTSIGGGDLPWAYALFVGALGLAASNVGYAPQNAFSFGFANGVNIAGLPDGETEIFVAPRATASEAAALQVLFDEGFASLGDVVKAPDGRAWAKDRYLERFSATATEDRFVVGVRLAASIPEGTELLAKLTAALRGLPPEVRARASAPADTGQPTGTEKAPANDESESYGEE